MKIKNLILIILTYFSAFYLYAFEMPLQNNISLITVSVTGAVLNPGIYKLPIDSRLSVAINKANYIPSIPQTQSQTKNSTISNNIYDLKLKKQKLNSSYRKIKIIRKDKVLFADLKKFYQLGDISQNPLLKDGDIIFVPSAKNFVYIYGEINSPGNYEILPDDTLSDIINLALGIKNSAYIDTILIFRYLKDNKTTKKIALNFKDKDKFLLKDGDRIFIRSVPEYHKNFNVKISGEIKYPGNYPINKNKTTR